MFSITCSSDNDFGDYSRHYINQDKNVKSRSFTLETDTGDETCLTPELGRDFNHRNQKAKYQLTPSYGVHGFWHHGYIWVERTQHIISSGEFTQESEAFTISTISWSIQPLKSLIQFAKEDYQRSTKKESEGRYLSDHRYHVPNKKK